MRTASDAAIAQIAGSPPQPVDADLLEAVNDEIGRIITYTKADFRDLEDEYSPEDIEPIVGSVLADLVATYAVKYGPTWTRALEGYAARRTREIIAEGDPGFSPVLGSAYKPGTIVPINADPYAALAKVLGLSIKRTEDTGVAPATAPVELTEDQSYDRCEAIVRELSTLKESDAGTILTYAVCRLGETKFGGAFINKAIAIVQKLRRV